MDFEISEQMTTILEMVGDFMDREVIPLEGEMLHGDPAALDEQVRAAQDKVRQMGVWAPNHPVEFGGLGLSMVDHGLLSEALGTQPARPCGVRDAGPRRRQHRDPAHARHRRAA